MDFFLAPEIKAELSRIVGVLKMGHINPDFLVAFKSYGSKSRAVARIWSLPHIWQMALEVQPHYCIEVVSEKFDRLNSTDKEKVLIHELLHIPKNFSGALLPHKQKKQRIDRKTVDSLHSQFVKFSRK